MLLPPALDALAITLVLLQRRGVEHAEHVALHPHRFHVLAALTGGAPVEMVDILQQGEYAGIGQRDAQHFGNVIGREMRFAEHHHDDGVGMAARDLGDLLCGVAVAPGDLAQVVARHAVEAIDPHRVLAGRDQQLVERFPVVSPVQVEADAFTQLFVVDLAAHPLVEDVLVAGEDRLHTQHHRPAAFRCSLQNLRSEALRGGQSVVIADQHHVSLAQLGFHLFQGQKGFIIAEGLAKVAEILAAAVGISGPEFALQAGEGVQLAGAAAA